MDSNSKILLIAYLFISVVFTFSCAKEGVEDVPIVTFLNPSENHHYTVGDTVLVKVRIQSISPIQSVDFTLVNDELTPVLSNFHYPNTLGTEAVVEYAFAINDDYLESGMYQILCQVTNAKTDKHKYQSVIFSAYDKVLEDVAVVTRLGNYIKVWSVGPALNKTPTLKFIVNMDYASSTYNPYYHRFALSGAVRGDVIVWDYFTEDTIQRIRYSANPPFPYFVDIAPVDKFLAVAYYQGKVGLFNYLGQQKLSLQLPTGYYPIQIVQVGQNFLVEQKHTNGYYPTIGLYLNQTASLHSTFMVDGTLVNAFPMGGNDFMMFYNNNFGGHLEKYIYQNNSTTEPVSYHSASFLNAIQIDPTNYCFSTEYALWWYRYNLSSVTNVMDERKFKILHYESVGGTIYAVENQTIRIISFPSFQMLYSLPMAEEIVDIHLIYNR